MDSRFGLYALERLTDGNALDSIVDSKQYPKPTTRNNQKPKQRDTIHIFVIHDNKQDYTGKGMKRQFRNASNNKTRIISGALLARQPMQILELKLELVPTQELEQTSQTLGQLVQQPVQIPLQIPRQIPEQPLQQERCLPMWPLPSPPRDSLETNEALRE